MTEVERKIMQEHVVYWKDLSDRRIAIIFGPVLDPKGTWGVAIVEVTSEPEAHILGRDDPAVQAGLTFEVYPMPGGERLSRLLELPDRSRIVYQKLYCTQ
jgi:uncharacterized protein YciI